MCFDLICSIKKQALYALKCKLHLCFQKLNKINRIRGYCMSSRAFKIMPNVCPIVYESISLGENL